MKYKKSQKGISIIAAIFTLIILGIFGMTIVTLVSADHEFRAASSSANVAFYNFQTGLEYAIREVDRGWYPIVTGKTFSKGNMTTEIEYSKVADDKIKVIGYVGDFQKRYQITYTPFAGDCTEFDTSSATLEGIGETDLTGVTFRKICNHGINIDKVVLTWDPDNGEKTTLINIDGNVVWEDLVGAVSGADIDILDTRFIDASHNPITMVRLTSSMSGKNLTIRFIYTDTSYETVTFALP